MRLLYAIQGTGNGHVARARAIVPLLRKHYEVDVLLSGDQSEVELPFAPDYRLRGLVMLYGENGEVSLLKTLLNLNARKLWRELKSLPVQNYDLVISDFEFVSAWACKWRRVPCLGIGHQAAFQFAETPRAQKRDVLGALILKYYAPCSTYLGYHFKSYHPSIKTPVIRPEIRSAKMEELGHYTVYLPAFSDEVLINRLRKLPKMRFEIFSKTSREAYKRNNCWVFPIDTEQFLRSFTSCTGIVTSAGFETPAEALFMGKKICVIPIQRQYEQACNAQALSELGVLVLRQLDDAALAQIRRWHKANEVVQINYPDSTEADLLEFLRQR